MNSDLLKIIGRVKLQHYRNGQLLHEEESENLVVDEGLTHYHSATLRGGTQNATWYIGIFANNRTPVATDTAATIAGLAGEITTLYDEAVRQTWTPNAAAGDPALDKVITNSSSTATFTINGSTNVAGAFLISDSTKGGTAGTLMAEKLFGSVRAAVSGDQIVITYQLTLSSS